MMDFSPAVLWFRRDLRLTDNPALAAAAASGRPLVALYILEQNEDDPWPLGGASRWWLHHSLTALAARLKRLGVPLTLRRGAAAAALDAVIAETGAETVFWNRRYDPADMACDQGIKAGLKAQGLAVHSFDASLLHQPWVLKTKVGGPFKVFTPFWKALRAATPAALLIPLPDRLTPHPVAPSSAQLTDWNLLPQRPDWAGGIAAAWQPGEAGAQAALDHFLQTAIGAYSTARDYPARPGTSRLSPHLHWGEIGPRQIWSQVLAETARRPAIATGAECFLTELGWREFAHHLLFTAPSLPDQPLRPEFAAFPWTTADSPTYRAWCQGMTGYPIIDAGMRELWQTGWMHNRVRMIAASFLVKDLLIDWRLGARWFWDTLVDADLANNAAGWQWVAGCGADAAPFFRIFNPVLQGRRFDPGGDYIRRYVPELAALDDTAIHEPAAYPGTALAANIQLGNDYPLPIIDHGQARLRALDALAVIK